MPQTLTYTVVLYSEKPGLLLKVQQRHRRGITIASSPQNSGEGGDGTCTVASGRSP